MTDNKQELQAVQDACLAIDLKFGKDIVALDIRGLTTVADYFIIATAGSLPQFQALTAAAEEAFAKHGYKLRHIEGLQSSNWVLMDFGDIFVHIFDKESRQFYNLERVWGDSRPLSGLVKSQYE